MSDSTTEVDYLVIGAGTAGMAFTDTLIGHSDRTVMMVERRHAPGGHWNDAYPFVRLHQPSAFYGVDSRELGNNRIDETGYNAGLYERASGLEILAYYRSVMEDHFRLFGQVTFLPMSDAVVDRGRVAVTSRLTGSVREITVRRKVVDARYLEGAIPATHRRSFDVDDDARCIAVNDLVRVDEAADGFIVLGGGKTSMDACLWLLDNGVDPDAITWIRPRDAWFLPRDTVQPRVKAGDTIISTAAIVEAAASAVSARDLFERLEAAGSLSRLDSSVEPTMYRGATASRSELEALRRITRVIRGRRVRRIVRDRIVFDDGDLMTTGRPLYVDCTASALSVPPVRPVFEDGRVTIQPLLAGLPSFSAALTGYIEATREDTAEQNRLAPPSRYPVTANDWISIRRDGMLALARWAQVDDVQSWVQRTRLNLTSGAETHMTEPRVAEAAATTRMLGKLAVENLTKLSLDLEPEGR
ncbi:hypothetical protein [Actinoplanes sp. NBRC 103695]|uniref:hypothetical protein n=1 Tax=Actinoplanes sp. NBRC 103695 TaxID=3032202 RepID=UPI0024A34E68|nr:hypothetical protein [Actinoplanes sp. NBRC 103695]GLY97298.1 hypothetical protein Acsp02_45520 [Actinoplanes sp. NBRC 103695]